METDAAHYAELVRNNAAKLIQQTVVDDDRNFRPLNPQTASGVLIAQSNLAIAATLAELADVLREKQ